MSLSARYLTGEYEEKNPTFHVEDSPWKARQIEKMLTAEGLAPQRVAEVGCGAGEILVQLAARYPAAQFHGYELSPQGFALCQQRASDRIQFSNEDFSKSAGPPFDVVLCIDVFEHVEDPFAFLRGLRGRGSSFLFHIPLDMNVQMVLRSEPLLRVREQVGHLHYFSKDTALSTLEECGYAVRAWFYTPNGVERPTSAKARLLQWPRRLLFSLHQDLTVRIIGGYSLLVHAVPRDPSME